MEAADARVAGSDFDGQVIRGAYEEVLDVQPSLWNAWLHGDTPVVDREGRPLYMRFHIRRLVRQNDTWGWEQTAQPDAPAPAPAPAPSSGKRKGVPGVRAAPAFTYTSDNRDGLDDNRVIPGDAELGAIQREISPGETEMQPKAGITTWFAASIKTAARLEWVSADVYKIGSLVAWWRRHRTSEAPQAVPGADGERWFFVDARKRYPRVDLPRVAPLQRSIAQQFTAHNATKMSIEAFCPSGLCAEVTSIVAYAGRIVVAARNPTIQVWAVGDDGDGLGVTQVLVGGGTNVNALAQHDAAVYSASDAVVSEWRPLENAAAGLVPGRDLHLTALLRAHTHPVRALAALGDGRVASGDEDGVVVVWAARDPPGAHRAHAVMRGAAGSGGVVCLAALPGASPASSALVVGYSNGALRVVAERAGAWGGTALPAGAVAAPVTCVAALPASAAGHARFVAGYANGALRVWTRGAGAGAGGAWAASTENTTHGFEAKDTVAVGSGEVAAAAARQTHVLAVAAVPNTGEPWQRFVSSGVDTRLYVWGVSEKGSVASLQEPVVLLGNATALVVAAPRAGYPIVLCGTQAGRLQFVLTKEIMYADGRAAKEASLQSILPPPQALAIADVEELGDDGGGGGGGGAAMVSAAPCRACARARR